MKALPRLAIASFMIPMVLGIAGITTNLSAATLVQTFEAGEDTSDWGSSWSAGDVDPTFLAQSLGGLLAGSGTSASQSFSRSFKNNTVGLDLSDAYTMSMYVQLDTYDGPSGGQFEIVDGDFGSGNAGNLRVTTTETPGVFKWQARDNSTGWQDMGIELSLSTPYRVVIDVNPSTFSYSATVQRTDTSGNVLATGSASNLSFDSNVINNHQNGTLLFYIQASAGGTSVLVDNINISTTAIPEPSTLALAGVGIALILRRRRSAC